MSWNIAKPGDQINGPVAVTGNLNVDSNTLFVDSANNRVGVLTASPTVPLDVVGDAKVSGNLTVDTNTLVVDAANNRLGIGTATPGATLDVTSNTNGQNRLLLNNPSTGSGAYVSLDFTAGTSNNQILSMGSGYSGSFPYSTGALVIRSNNVNGIVINTSGSAAPITFGINDSTAMTLNGTGLGVGVSPSHKLHVVGTAANLVRFQSTAASGPYVIFENASAIFGDIGSQLAISGTGSASNMLINARSTGSLMLATGDTARLTVDSSGNVIRGATAADTTSTDSATMVNIGNFAVQNAASSGTFLAVKPGAANGTVDICADARSGNYPNLRFFTSSTTQMTLTAGGNLGLGVTPSAWGAGLKALQVGAVSYGSLFDFGNGVTSLSSNLFFSGSSYGRMSTSSRWSMAYWQDITNGAHSWVTSTAAGTNASTPTMSTLMTLDSSGKLGIGSTPSTNLSIGSGSGSGGYGGGVYLNRGGSSYNFYEAGDGTNTVIFGLDHTLSYAKIGSINSYPISLITDNSVRLTVKATGQVNFVGLASDPAGAAAGDVYYNTTTNKLKCYNGTTWNDLF